MPDWLRAILPDAVKDVVLLLLGAGGTGLLVLFRHWLRRLTPDEKTLLRWAFEEPGNRLIVVETMGQPRAVQVGGLRLTRERERWLGVCQRLVHRGALVPNPHDLFRVADDWLELARTFPADCPAKHSEPQWFQTVGPEALPDLLRQYSGSVRIHAPSDRNLCPRVEVLRHGILAGNASATAGWYTAFERMRDSGQLVQSPSDPDVWTVCPPTPR